MYACMYVCMNVFMGGSCSREEGGEGPRRGRRHRRGSTPEAGPPPRSGDDENLMKNSSFGTIRPENLRQT